MTEIARSMFQFIARSSTTEGPHVTTFLHTTDLDVSSTVTRFPFYTPDLASATSLAQQVQDMHDLMPDSGGVIAIPTAPTNTTIPWDVAVRFTKPVALISFGHKAGSDSNGSRAPVTVAIASGITAITIGNGSALFCGVKVQGIAFKSVDGTGRAIFVNNMSNCQFGELTFEDFTGSSGQCMEFSGNAGQYSRLNNCYFHNGLNNVKITDYNGIIFDGCFIDGNGNNNSPRAGSIGIFVTNGSADTIRIVNSQFQGLEVCIDTSGTYTTVSGCRFENFGNQADALGKAIIFRGQDQILGDCCTFNNNINTLGGSSSGNRKGYSVSLESTATRPCISRHANGLLNPGGVIDQGCSNPIRDDCLSFAVSVVATMALPASGDMPFKLHLTPAQVASIPLIGFAANTGFQPTGNYLLQNVRIYNGDSAAIATDGTNYWEFQLRRKGNTISQVLTYLYTNGTALPAWGTVLVGGSAQAIATGDCLLLEVIPHGTPTADLVNIAVSGLLVPY